MIRRVEEHKNEVSEGFTKKYKCKKLVYYEDFFHVEDAIKREKELKGWKRSKKIDLINNSNARWDDLYNTLIDFDRDPSLRSG